MATEINTFGVCNSAFYVCRELNPDSVNDLSFRKDLTIAFKGYDIKPKQDQGLAVSILERGEVYRAREICKQLGNMSVNSLYYKIVKPLEHQDLEPLELKVCDVKYFGRRLGRRSLALVLEDDNHILESERSKYTKRLSDEVRWKLYTPHLSIAKLDLGSTIDEILEWVEERCPPTISVGPVSVSNIMVHNDHYLS